MPLKTIKRNIERHGPIKALADASIRLANRFIFFQVLKCVEIATVDPAFLECDPEYRGLFLTQEMLTRFGANPEYEIPEKFLANALAKGDECYGFVKGDELAAYGWYSHAPTETNWPGLQIRFDDRFVYMYKGFTHPRHRGKRLHAVGMTRALADYLSRGDKGIVSYVEWNNFDSLKSCYRMGYKDAGTIVAAGVAGHYGIYNSAGCKPFGFRLQAAVNAVAPRVPATTTVYR